MRPRSLLVAVTLLSVALMQGCGIDESRNGPPFHPGNIRSPRSLLVTKSDIEGIGGSTPYGAVLRWWRALQRGDVKGAQHSYAAHVSARAARRQVDGFQPRFSQPVQPDVEEGNKRATVDVVVRSAIPLGDLPSVINVTDVPVIFDVVRSSRGWKLDPNSYGRYHRAVLDELADRG